MGLIVNVFQFLQIVILFSLEFCVYYIVTTVFNVIIVYHLPHLHID